MADVVPIAFFQLSFIYLYGRKIGQRYGLLLLSGFIIASIMCGQLPQHWLNGSISYAPALLFLGGLGLYHWQTKQEQPAILLLATGLFMISLTFRTFDMAICTAIPFGVHFLWHILNAVVLYLTVRSLLVDRHSATVKIPPQTNQKE